jgi:hypothetical protein
MRADILDPVSTAVTLARVHGLAPEASRMLAAMLDSLDRGLGHRLRDVDGTLADVQRAAPTRRREILAAMASVSLADGDSGAALARYVEAAELGWSPTVFRAARALARARGDRDIERRMAALLAADPLSEGHIRDSIRAADPTLASDEAWAAYLAAGELEIARRVSVDGAGVDASRAIRLAPWGTRQVTARRLDGGRPTVIALWSRACPASAPQLPALARLQAVLARRGIDLLVVTRDEPSEDLASFVAGQRAAPVIHHDPENTAARTFAAYGWPHFFVLDGRGRLRTRAYDITTVGAEALAVAGMSGGRDRHDSPD